MNSDPNEPAMSRSKTTAWLKTAIYGLGAAMAVLCSMWVIVSAEHVVPLMPPAGETIEGHPAFRFAIVGDNQGNMSTFETVLGGIKNKNVDFILHTGDIVKRPRERRFNWVLHEINEERLGIPVYAVPGNHDILEDADTVSKQYRLYNRAFGPRRYWFAYGDALFVAFDNASKQASQDNLEWLDSTLANHRDKYSLCFVYMHVPPRDPRGKSYSHAMTAGGNQLVEILKKHNVSAVFAGHIHGYLKDNLDGVPEYITGGAGSDLYEDAGGQHNYLI
ncbi:MAG: metallophosphoesterase, partial [Candidatus Hydrogenedentes bacterium]|nr:metallophosphoesterase [Candidatus Hydrogenedentota bacterium]